MLFAVFPSVKCFVIGWYIGCAGEVGFYGLSAVVLMRCDAIWDFRVQLFTLRTIQLAEDIDCSFSVCFYDFSFRCATDA